MKTNNMLSLIFDIDGTLWDSTALVAVGYNAQLRDEGLERYFVTADDLKKLFGKTMTEIADILFYDIPVERRYPLMERCMKREGSVLHSDPCRVGYPKVKETLEQLAERHKLYIVSNSQSGYPQLVMEKMGIGAYISGHLCYGDTGTCKGETILQLMREHGIDDAVYIGDTQGDMEASDLAGLPFVYCAYGFGKPEHYTHRIEQFADLVKLF